MSSPDPWPLVCPICDAPLGRVERTLRCPTGHSFDIAREGYVNLLPPQHRPRGVEGDTPEMVRARRRFHEGGWYAPLRDHLAERVAAVVESDSSIAEIGCGEGYYIGGIGGILAEEHGIEPRLFGMDLSKAAVRMAARRHPAVQFFVGDVNRQIYLADSSLQVLLDIFAPRNPGEFARVLAPGGNAIVVIPAPDHLSEIRAEFGLLSIQEEKEERTLSRFEGLFELSAREELQYDLSLPPAALADLIAMGPNQWHLEPGWRIPEEVPSFQTKAAFVVLTLSRI